MEMEETPEHIIDIQEVENLLKNGFYSLVSKHLEEKLKKLIKDEKGFNSEVVNIVMRELDKVENLLSKYKPKGKNPFRKFSANLSHVQIKLDINYYKKMFLETT